MSKRPGVAWFEYELGVFELIRASLNRVESAVRTLVKRHHAELIVIQNLNILAVNVQHLLTL